MTYKAAILSITFSLIIFANLFAQDSLKAGNTNDSYKNNLLKLNFEIPTGWTCLTSKEEFENINLSDERLNIGVYSSSAIIELRKDKEEIIPSIRIFVKTLPEESKVNFSKLSSIDYVERMSLMTNRKSTIYSVSLKKYKVGYTISKSKSEKQIVGMILSADFLYQVYITFDKNDPNCTEQEFERIFKSFDID
jgi:hypothetical protein